MISPNIFDVTEGNTNACRNVYNIKLGRIRNDQIRGGGRGWAVTRGCSKKSKTRSLDGRTRLCPMPILTQVTPRTVDVRISDAEER